MTRSRIESRGATGRRAKGLAGAITGLLGVFVLLGVGCDHHRGHGNAKGFASAGWDVEIISAKIGGKNVFIPSTIAVADHNPVTLTVFNTTDTPHGFAIDELGIRAVIPSGEETRIELPKLEGHQILKIYCQLHPPHRSATLVVFRGLR